ncbi:MAG: Lrp/AsnC ligand binding domain-containing protein [Saprospiraceae bacterium]
MKSHPDLDPLDKTDTQLLSILSTNASLSYVELGKMLYVSSGTIHVRIKKLTHLGYIKGTIAKLDYSKVGFDICAFLGIYLEKSNMYQDVKKDLESIPEIIEAHYTTGNYSIFLKILCRDTDHLREILSKKIQSIKGIQRTETFISLEEAILRPLILTEIKR